MNSTMQFPLLVTAAFFCFTASISTQQEYAEQLSAAIQEGDEPPKLVLLGFSCSCMTVLNRSIHSRQTPCLCGTVNDQSPFE